MYSVILFNVIFILSICSTGTGLPCTKVLQYFPYILELSFVKFRDGVIIVSRGMVCISNYVCSDI
jgi:hypothetical protein